MTIKVQMDPGLLPGLLQYITKVKISVQWLEASEASESRGDEEGWERESLDKYQMWRLPSRPQGITREWMKCYRLHFTLSLHIRGASIHRWLFSVGLCWLSSTPSGQGTCPPWVWFCWRFSKGDNTFQPISLIRSHSFVWEATGLVPEVVGRHVTDRSPMSTLEESVSVRAMGLISSSSVADF